MYVPAEVFLGWVACGFDLAQSRPGPFAAVSRCGSGPQEHGKDAPCLVEVQGEFDLSRIWPAGCRLRTTITKKNTGVDASVLR